MVLWSRTKGGLREGYRKHLASKACEGTPDPDTVARVERDGHGHEQQQHAPSSDISLSRPTNSLNLANGPFSFCSLCPAAGAFWYVGSTD